MIVPNMIALSSNKQMDSTFSKDIDGSDQGSDLKSSCNLRSMLIGLNKSSRSARNLLLETTQIFSSRESLHQTKSFRQALDDVMGDIDANVTPEVSRESPKHTGRRLLLSRGLSSPDLTVKRSWKRDIKTAEPPQQQRRAQQAATFGSDSNVSDKKLGSKSYHEPKRQRRPQLTKQVSERSFICDMEKKSSSIDELLEEYDSIATAGSKNQTPTKSTKAPKENPLPARSRLGRRQGLAKTKSLKDLFDEYESIEEELSVTKASRKNHQLLASRSAHETRRMMTTGTAPSTRSSSLQAYFPSSTFHGRSHDMDMMDDITELSDDLTELDSVQL